MTVETLAQEAQSLPQDERLRLIMLLVEQLRGATPTPETRREILNQVRGMFRGMPGTEEFQAEKRRELEEEERKFFVRRRNPLTEASE
jgi:hypothetical protein